MLSDESRSSLIGKVNVDLFIVTMPFGGFGFSGIGKYYGKHEFDSLTNSKSILTSPSDITIEHLFAPYTIEKARDLQKRLEY